MDVPIREPEIFAAGDTLWFEKYLPELDPANGWALTYTVTNEAGNMVVQVQSVPVGNRHKIYANAFLAAQQAGNYVLSGEAIMAPNANAPQGYEHQIYYGPLKVSPDLEAGAANQDMRTRAQKKLAQAEKAYDAAQQDYFQLTEVQRNRFEKQKLEDLLNQIKYWQEVRFNEIQMERARSGRPTGLQAAPLFSIGT